MAKKGQWVSRELGTILLWIIIIGTIAIRLLIHWKELYYLGKCNTQRLLGLLNIVFVWIGSKPKRLTFIQCFKSKHAFQRLIFLLNFNLLHYASETFKMWRLGLTLLKFDNFTFTPDSREIKFWRIQTVHNVLFGNFRDSEFWILVHFGLESCSDWLKSKFRISKIAKNDIFEPFEYVNIWFLAKSECR